MEAFFPASISNDSSCHQSVSSGSSLAIWCASFFVSTVGYEPFSARPEVVTNSTLNTTNPIILTPAK
ncbi:not available [Bacillus cereus]|nr:not available [Bacillus cereus]